MFTAKYTAVTIIILSVCLLIACSDDDKPTTPRPPQGLQFIGQHPTLDRAGGVIVQGDYAYVADHDSGMLIINISNPAQPTLTGRYQCPGAVEIDIDGNHAYIADESLYSLEIVDISNPAQPTLTGRFDTLEVLGIKLMGDYALMGCGNEGLNVVNVSDPAHPSLAGSCNDIELLRFVLLGNYALVPGENGHEGFFTVNLSDPTQPVVAGSVPTGGSPWEVAVKGNYAYMTNLGAIFTMADTGFMHIIDISDLDAPRKVDSMFLGNATLAAFVSGNYLYVGFGYEGELYGFSVLNVSNPVTPTAVATQPLTGIPRDIWVENNYIYIAADTSGLLIYQYNP